MRAQTDLIALRQQAQDLLGRDEHADFLALLPELRGDGEMWSLWCAYGARAARFLERPEAYPLLEEAIQAGYSEPSWTADAFRGDPQWPEWVRRMEQRRPEPWVRLLEWPEAEPMFPLELSALEGERLEAFRAEVPPPLPSAWATAQMLLSWAHGLWPHNGTNESAKGSDALEILGRARRGERFRCVEYGQVLAAALNASEIPARTVGLRMTAYHTGLGRGHIAAEAWIDDLGKWVLLDGQNGAFWLEDSVPLGTGELRDWFGSGQPLPDFCRPDGEKLSPEDTQLWAAYFASVSTPAGWYAPPGELPSPQSQDRHWSKSPRLVREAGRLWLDLGKIELGFGEGAGKPYLKLSSPHPYAKGFRVGGLEHTGNPASVPLEDLRGMEELELQTLTTYGALRTQSLRLEWA